MVRHHVAQGSGVVEVPAPALHANALGIGDLHMVDIAAIPERLENGIVKAEDQDVLYRLFAEVVIDAVDLVFLEHALDIAVQRLGGVQVVSKWLLDHDPAPVCIVLLRQASSSQLLDDRRKKPGRGREVKKIITLSVVLGVYPG